MAQPDLHDISLELQPLINGGSRMSLGREFADSSKRIPHDRGERFENSAAIQGKRQLRRRDRQKEG